MTADNGAKNSIGKLDIPDSKYFTSLDYFNMKSTDILTLLPNFATLQQDTEYTCGPCCALMLLNHSNQDSSEAEIARICSTSPTIGTNTQQLVDYFTGIGWKVESSLDSPKTPTLQMLRDNLAKGIPTMVEWLDWGGHWQIVIGYDTMGTDNEQDHVLIFADPYDIGDHHQDGYYVYPAYRFFSMWFDAQYLPDNMKKTQWITATAF